jgi:hypothetical protein
MTVQTPAVRGVSAAWPAHCRSARNKRPAPARRPTRRHQMGAAVRPSLNELLAADDEANG